LGGFFGVASKDDCVRDLFYGTDYHSHLGTKRGGLAVANRNGIVRYIHNIENAQFRSKFEDDVQKLQGTRGIGVISDYEDQPLLIRSHLGNFAIVTVGVIKNIDQLVQKAFRRNRLHFSEMRGGEINPTEVVAALINQEETFEDGIRNAGSNIVGSCSMLLLTDEGVIAAAMETCAFPNLDFETVRDLVARMKLIPIRENIVGQRLLFCEDSIVRGTQLKDTIQRLYDFGALEVHMRPAGTLQSSARAFSLV
jgi:amidophosphoribosyltransferase